jgi:hydrogenase maturation factor
MGDQMKVRILENGSGLLDGRPFPSIGDEVELPTGLAISLINDKRAEAVAETAAETRETAAEAAPEKRGPGRPRKAA